MSIFEPTEDQSLSSPIVAAAAADVSDIVIDIDVCAGNEVKYGT